MDGERQSSRVTVDRPVICRHEGQMALVMLYDLSNDGCMIEAPNEAIREGDPIEIALFEEFEVGGTVRWLRAGHIGVQFDSLLHPVVVQHLGFRQPAPTFAAKRPVDRFGRPLGALTDFDPKLTLLRDTGEPGAA